MMANISVLRFVFTALFLLGSVLAVPLADKLGKLSPAARDLLKRSVPAAPRFVSYNDAWLSQFPTADQLSGFNVFALSFLLVAGPADEAQAWSFLSADQRSTYLNEYDAAGISLIVSAFGASEIPTSQGVDPVALANTMANWVLQYNLHGIDVDYEDFGAFDGGSGTAEPWLIDFTRQLRTHLPQGQYILSHAPVAPWFTPNAWSGGGYLIIDQTVGYLIDWYNVQYYNQGSTEYTTCNDLLYSSSSQFPESALFQIAANGVPLSKLVIGKPGTQSDANNGYMPASTLATCVSQAHDAGWDAGVMVWEYPDVGSAWIKQVRGSAFP